MIDGEITIDGKEPIARELFDAYARQGSMMIQTRYDDGTEISGSFAVIALESKGNGIVTFRLRQLFPAFVS